MHVVCDLCENNQGRKQVETLKCVRYYEGGSVQAGVWNCENELIIRRDSVVECKHCMKKVLDSDISS